MSPPYTYTPEQHLICSQPSPPPPPRLLIMCSLVLAQLWGAPKFTGSRGQEGVRESLLRPRSESCVAFFPAPPLILPPSCVFFVCRDKKSGGSRAEASQSPTDTLTLKVIRSETTGPLSLCARHVLTLLLQFLSASTCFMQLF